MVLKPSPSAGLKSLTSEILSEPSSVARRHDQLIELRAGRQSADTTFNEPMPSAKALPALIRACRAMSPKDAPAVGERVDGAAAGQRSAQDVHPAAPAAASDRIDGALAACV